jgi:hypothetical protein
MPCWVDLSFNTEYKNHNVKIKNSTRTSSTPMSKFTDIIFLICRSKIVVSNLDQLSVNLFIITTVIQRFFSCLSLLQIIVKPTIIPNFQYRIFRLCHIFQMKSSMIMLFCLCPHFFSSAFLLCTLIPVRLLICDRRVKR